MALEAHKLYKQIAFEEDIRFDKVEKGILHIYTNKQEFDNARRVNEIYARAGLKRWEVSADECLKIEPALVPPPELLGGMFNSTDYTGDIHKFCVQLTKVLQEKYKVKYEQRNITHIRQINDLRGPVVVCAGIGSRKLAKSVNDCLLYTSPSPRDP